MWTECECELNVDVDCQEEKEDVSLFLSFSYLVLKTKKSHVPDKLERGENPFPCQNTYVYKDLQTASGSINYLLM